MTVPSRDHPFDLLLPSRRTSRQRLRTAHGGMAHCCVAPRRSSRSSRSTSTQTPDHCAFRPLWNNNSWALRRCLCCCQGGGGAPLWSVRQRLDLDPFCHWALRHWCCPGEGGGGLLDPELLGSAAWPPDLLPLPLLPPPSLFFSPPTAGRVPLLHRRPAGASGLGMLLL